MTSSLKLSSKRILVTTIGVPHPSNGASVVLFFHYIKSFVDQGASIFHVVIWPNETDCRVALDVYRTALGEKADINIQTVKSQQPFCPNRFGVNSNIPNVAHLIEDVKKFRPHAGLAFDLAAGGVLNSFDLPYKTIWLGDLLFKSNWYNYLYSFKENLLTIRWLPYAIAQTCCWKNLYQGILKNFDDVIVSSKSSEAALAQLGIKSKFYPYPWPQSPIIIRQGYPTKPRFLFFGTLIGLGSRSSLHFLFRKVYPLLLEYWGKDGFEILIGGRDKPRDWMLLDMAACPEVKFVGFIKDLGETMQDCHAVIAPLDVPVGNRSRILTAWSMRALVVTHINAALGNPSLRDGETAYLAKTAKEFVEKMIISVENTEKSNKIVDQALDRYLKEYSIEKASSLFVELISGADNV